MDRLARRVRGVALLATLALHGLLLAAPWRPSREPVAREVDRAPAPLLVMLLSDHVGRGMAPPAQRAPADASGLRQVPQPPPAAEEPPSAPALAPDRPALPVTAPDLGPLGAFRAPSAPIRLRLHIDVSGAVSAVEVLESDPGDVAFVERLAEILRATPHIPARRGGQDVASTKEIRLSFGAAG